MSYDLKGRYHSCSSSTEYLECPRSYELRRVRRVEVDERQDPWPWRLGTAWHEAMAAAAYEARRIDEAQFSGDTTMEKYSPHATDAMLTAWERLALGELDGKRDRALEGLQRLLGSIWAPDKPTHVLGVEEHLVARTPNGTIVHGYADLLLRTDPRTILVRDWKTGSNRPDPAALGSDFQLATYAWLVRQLHPWVTTVLGSHHPTNHAVPETAVEVTVEAGEAAAAAHDAVAEQVSLDVDWTPRPGPRCETCQYRTPERCPEGVAHLAAQSAPTDSRGAP